VSKVLAKLWPHRITTQIALLVVMSLIIAHLAIAAVLISLYPRPDLPLISSAYTAKLIYTAKLLNSASGPDERGTILKVARMELPGILFGPLVNEARHGTVGPLAADLQAQLGTTFTVFEIGDTDSEFPRIVIELSDALAVSAPFPPSDTGRPELPAILTIAFLAFAIVLLSVWAARTLTAPLRQFADAAEKFTVGRIDVPLPERGPREIVRTARALNGMRERIQRMVEDRAQMLAAISHDLRTPITRLRLRAEEIEPETLRIQVIQDLEAMQAMSQAALSFLRDEAATKVHLQIDFTNLVQKVLNNFGGIGYCIDFDCRSHIYVNGDVDQLIRALSNLIENGLKFGKKVSIALRIEKEMVQFDVEDDGPGIIDEEKLRVMEPFYKSDGSRALKQQNSFGLGLSIARAIAAAHQGQLSLHDAMPKGLIARLTLPLSQNSKPDEAPKRNLSGA
jgi:signal transduction histidine kinase